MSQCPIAGDATGLVAESGERKGGNGQQTSSLHLYVLQSSTLCRKTPMLAKLLSTFTF